MNTIELLAKFFDLKHTAHRKIFQGLQCHLWEIFEGKIAAYIQENQPIFQQKYQKEEARFGPPVISSDAHIGEKVVIGPGTIIEPFAHIKGPALIGKNCTIRSCAYLRENVIIGDRVVVGHATEVKHALLFDEVEVPHRNYIGNSILGWRAHLGANVIISNVRLDKKTIRAKVKNQLIDTHLRKFGAIIGDQTEVGANSTISPGSVIGKSCIIYPNTTVNRFLDSNHILRMKQDQRAIMKRS